MEDEANSITLDWTVPTISVGEWYHLVMVFDDDRYYTLYMNGSLISKEDNDAFSGLNIDRIGGSITEATTTKGKLDLFGEGKLFGKKSKTPRTKVIKGVEKEWRGGRWMTKKPAPTKNYKKGYYGA